MRTGSSICCPTSCAPASAIACSYEDADDLDWLRFDPALKLACGRLPDTRRDLCSQPTSRAGRTVVRSDPPDGRDDRFHRASDTKPPEAVTLDIDDTVAQIASTTRALQAMLEVIDRSRREGFDVLDKTDEYGRASPR